MKVVTVATKPHPALRLLRQSFSRFKSSADTFVVLGNEEAWTGFGGRILRMLDYLSAQVQSGDGDEIVLLLDAYDLLITNPLESLEDWYRISFVSSSPPADTHSPSPTENTDFPLVALATERHGVVSSVLNSVFVGPPPVLNGTKVPVSAGTWLGTARSLSNAFSIMCQLEGPQSCLDREADDQRLLTQMAHTHSELFYADISWSHFVTTIHDLCDGCESQLEYNTDGTLRFEENKYPNTLHLAFGGNLASAATRLGYELSTEEMSSLTDRGVSYYLRFWEHHLRNRFRVREGKAWWDWDDGLVAAAATLAVVILFSTAILGQKWVGSRSKRALKSRAVKGKKRKNF